MTSLSFPDVNVWFALVFADHVHRPAALAWWNKTSTQQIGLTRMTQIGLLRLSTTAAAMNNQPLSMSEAWRVHDKLYEDERVMLYPEPVGFDEHFRRLTSSASASPKVWADAYLLAFAASLQAQVVTFDRALEARAPNCLILR